MAEWERLVATMEITLAGVYAHARLLGWNDSGIELAFPKGSLQAALGADTDKLAKLKALVASQTGHPFDIKVKEIANMPAVAPVAPSASAANGSNGMPAHMSSAVGDPVPSGASASVAERDDQRRRAERERRESEARQHPLTKAAIDTFGATIKEIKVDG
jgi:hypothetical protein